MQLTDQLIQFLQQALEVLQQGIAAVFRFVRVLWQWSVEQVMAIPWDQLDNLPLWKVVVLVLTGAGVGWLLYSAARILLDAGEKALVHFIGFLAAFIRTLIPILLAGGLAAGGAWIVNNVHLNNVHFNNRY